MMLTTFVQRLSLPDRQRTTAALQASWEAARRDPALTLWRVATAPLWIGSDMPVPAAPSRRDADWGGLATADAGPGRQVRIELARLHRRYRWSWLLTSLLRGIALGLGIALLWMLLALATGVPAPDRWWIGGLMLAGLALGAAFGAVNRPTPLRLARSLDQTFHLHERLTTALDPTLGDPRDPAMQLQYADTANALAEIRPEFPLSSFIPFREVFVALIAGMLLLAAFFANVPTGELPAASTNPVPPFAPAADRLAAQQAAPTTGESALPQEPPVQDARILEQAQTSNQTRQDLEALGDALSDYALTKPASESIAQGDYGQAADDLHSAADNADTLSPEARSSLADDLDQAAARMSPANPDLAQASRETAASLREEDGTAGERLDQLADEVDRAGQKVAPNAQIAAGPESSTSAPPGSTTGSETEPSSGQAQGEGSQGAPAQVAGDPGSGAQAQPGLASDEIDPQNQRASQSGEGSGEQQGGSGQAPPGTQGQPGTADGGAPESGMPGDTANANQSGADSATGQGDADSANASQGAGAGGESDVESQGGESQRAGGGTNEQTSDRPEADTSGQGRAAESPPGGEASGGDDDEAARSGRDSLVLEGTSDENIPSGSDVGSSSLGSGSGASAASGNAAPVEVGEAGPDSNRVPTEYRDYVESYFNRDRP